MYARPEAQEPFKTEAELEAAPETGYLDYVQTDGSEEGFFQLALLTLMGDQFYLWWHANYNDQQIMASPNASRTPSPERIRSAAIWSRE